MSKWRHLAEHWETQGLLYWVLGLLISDKHPTAAMFAWAYGAWCLLGVLYASYKAAAEEMQ